MTKKMRVFLLSAIAACSPPIDWRLEIKYLYLLYTDAFINKNVNLNNKNKLLNVGRWALGVVKVLDRLIF